MKKIDFGQTISIFANIGVIAGIVFLAAELRQNNELLQADASLNRFNIERERRERIMENRGGLAEIILKKNNDVALDDIQALQHQALMLDLLESLRWYFEEVRAGRLPPGSIDIENWRTVWRVNPELAELITEQRPALDPAFLEFIDREIAAE
jgi:hypothetical protein